MAFRPFGDPFVITSSLQPEQAKTAIRSGLRKWLDVKGGARGWIVGNTICLWLSAFDKQGPMLLGRIKPDKSGTCVSGRAGSDLNGSLFAVLICLALAVLIYYQNLDGMSTVQTVLLSLLAVGVPGLVLWAKHAFRKDAAPLVHYLDKVLAPSGKADVQATEPIVFKRELSMDINGAPFTDELSSADIFDALQGLDSGEFLILIEGDQHYLQAYVDSDLLIMEKRDGGHSRHYRAERAGASPPQALETHFTKQEIWLTIKAYLTADQEPDFLRWVKHKV